MALPVISGDTCVRALSRVGYVLVGQKGSHARLQCEGRTSLTVPMHSELDRGTLRSIIRDSGLSVEEFLELL